MRLVIVWGFLIAATLASVLIGEGSKSGPTATAVILAIAFVKVRFVFQEFMEVRTAPRALGVVTDIWAFALWGLLIKLPTLAAG